MMQKKKPALGSGGLKKSSSYNTKSGIQQQSRVDFKELAECIKPYIASLVQRLLPQGRFDKYEYIALNPTRSDQHLGSFRINTRTGQWADFATNDRGRDFISLCAYVKGISQLDAAKELQHLLRGGM